jgi:nucleoid-associated protein YgaU
MGLFDFVKEAGANLLGMGDDDEKPAAQADEAVRTHAQAVADRKKGDALAKLVGDMGMHVENLQVQFRDGVAVLQGKTDSQAEREKVVLMVGNTQGVAQVDDRLVVEKPEPEAVMYTVQSGDSLSKIAKQQYGNAMKYMVIFEANQPMLKDPNKIYPGQVLRIPPLEQ